VWKETGDKMADSGNRSYGAVRIGDRWPRSGQRQSDKFPETPQEYANIFLMITG